MYFSLKKRYFGSSSSEKRDYRWATGNCTSCWQSEYGLCSQFDRIRVDNSKIASIILSNEITKQKRTMNRTETEMCFLISSVDQGKNHKIFIIKR